jgi:beta-lactamase class A
MLSAVPLLLLALPAAPPETGLADRITPLVKAHKGKVAIAVKHLETGESFFLNENEVMPTASLIKLPVLIETYLQADEGKLKLTDKFDLKDADKVPGSGILTYHFSAGASLSVRDYVRLMIAFSDNTATNLVIDKVGIASVNRRMADWGLAETRLNSKVFRRDTSVDMPRSKRYGLGSTTAHEMVKLLEELMIGERVRPPLKQAILTHLRKNDDKDKFPRLLPAGTVAHKDGAVSNARTDAGLLFTPAGVIALCVLTDGNADRRWASDNAGNVLCAKVAKAVYDHFNEKDQSKAASASR